MARRVVVGAYHAPAWTLHGAPARAVAHVQRHDATCVRAAGVATDGLWSVGGRAARQRGMCHGMRCYAIANQPVPCVGRAPGRGFPAPLHRSLHTATPRGAGAAGGGWKRRKGAAPQNASPGGPSIKLRVQVDRVMFYAPDSGYTVARGRVVQLPDGASTADAGVGDSITMQGRGGVASLTEGAVVNVEGVWTTHAKYGRQLRVDSSSTASPRTPEAIAQCVHRACSIHRSC